MYILFSFVKLLFNIIEINNSNVKTLKIIKKIIFALFVSEKNKKCILRLSYDSSSDKASHTHFP